MSLDFKNGGSDEIRDRVARINVAMREAAEDAIQLHLRLGLPLVEWHDGQIVLVAPETVSAD
jgi:hypothetical protein